MSLLGQSQASVKVKRPAWTGKPESSNSHKNESKPFGAFAHCFVSSFSARQEFLAGQPGAVVVSDRERGVLVAQRT